MSRFVGVDLFAGAGGMTLGAQLAGVDVKFAVELDRFAAATYSTNHPKVRLHADDILSVTELPFERRAGQQLIVFGGPPCQGFSTSNQRTRSGQNPRNWLFKEFLRLVDTWEPEWVVFENVRGITETEKGVFLENILNDLNQIGYTANHGVLNSVHFGVPQKRSRLFIVASRDGVKMSMPAPTSKTIIAVKDVLHDLPDLCNGARINVLPYRGEVANIYTRRLRKNLYESSGHLVSRNAPYVVERYSHIPPGGNWENIPDALMGNYADKQRCHTGIYHRLDPDKPSVVIGNYRKNMLIHPSEDRGLSVREAARIQSFPDDYEFAGSIGFQQQQVGNAVPPLLAQAVFRTLTDMNSIQYEIGTCCG